MSSPLELRVKELCAIVAAKTGPEQEAAFEELKVALAALIHEAENISKYNLLHFPRAMEKRKRMS
jgi:hypothetical protein